MKIKGSELFVKALQEEGVDTLFAYPGGYVIDLFDALYQQDGIQLVLPRHEQALIHEADGYARATGKVGVCLVTSGPGATNLVTGIATANFDSVPLVCFTGQVERELIGDNAFQEVDIVDITKSICKYCVTVRNRQELGEIIKKAFYIARTGKPGPVLVDIPRDIQKELGTSLYQPKEWEQGHTNLIRDQITAAITALNQAKKPVFLVGGGVKIAKAEKELTKLVEQMGVPVITTIMGRGSIATSHPLYIGNIGMHGSYAANHAVCECDLLFAIGARFSDRITGKTSEFAKNAKIVHLDIDLTSISRNIAVDIQVKADAKKAIEFMLEYTKKLTITKWLKAVLNWKENYPLTMSKYEGMTPEDIICAINNLFSSSVVVTDVGQNQLWTTQYIELDSDRQLITSGGLGTMGFGLPAAIGAKLGRPDKAVICISGDGGMQMNIQELATAAALKSNIIICIMNNSYLGNVRQWQEMFYGKRYSGTCLCDCETLEYRPDFIQLAKSYGIKGLRVDSKEEIIPALRAAHSNTSGPTLIEFIIEPELNVMPIVPPGQALDAIMMG